MQTALKYALLLFVLVVNGCAPSGPPFASVAGTIPPLAPGSARIYFYRWLEPYETITPTEAFLNDKPVGLTQTGAVFYRDVTPGQYTISVDSYGVYPNQFKTVLLKSGDVAYARIESLKSWVPCGSGGADGAGGSGGGDEGCRDTFVVVLMDPSLAQAEMGSLYFFPG